MPDHTLPDTLSDKWIPQSVAMERTGLSRTSFFEKRRQGIFECRRYRRMVIVLRSDVERFLKNLPVA